MHGDSHKRDKDGRPILQRAEETLLHYTNELPGANHALPLHALREEEVCAMSQLYITLSFYLQTFVEFRIASRFGYLVFSGSCS